MPRITLAYSTAILLKTPAAIAKNTRLPQASNYQVQPNSDSYGPNYSKRLPTLYRQLRQRGNKQANVQQKWAKRTSIQYEKEEIGTALVRLKPVSTVVWSNGPSAISN